MPDETTGRTDPFQTALNRWVDRMLVDEDRGMTRLGDATLETRWTEGFMYSEHTYDYGSMELAIECVVTATVKFIDKAGMARRHDLQDRWYRSWSDEEIDFAAVLRELLRE